MCAGGPGFTSAAGSPRFRAADEPCTPTLTGANDLHTLRGAIDLRTGAANVRSMSKMKRLRESSSQERAEDARAAPKAPMIERGRTHIRGRGFPKILKTVLICALVFHIMPPCCCC